MRGPKVRRAKNRLAPTVQKLAQAIEHRLPDDLRYVVLVFAMDDDENGLDVGIASNATPVAAAIAMQKMIDEMTARRDEIMALQVKGSN